LPWRPWPCCRAPRVQTWHARTGPVNWIRLARARRARQLRQPPGRMLLMLPLMLSLAVAAAVRHAHILILCAYTCRQGKGQRPGPPEGNQRVRARLPQSRLVVRTVAERVCTPLTRFTRFQERREHAQSITPRPSELACSELKHDAVARGVVAHLGDGGIDFRRRHHLDLGLDAVLACKVQHLLVVVIRPKV